MGEEGSRAEEGRLAFGRSRALPALSQEAARAGALVALMLRRRGHFPRWLLLSSGLKAGGSGAESRVGGRGEQEARFCDSTCDLYHRSPFI